MGKHVSTTPLDFDKPGLMIDACGYYVHLTAMQLCVGWQEPFTLCPVFDHAGNLPVRSLDTMTEANSGHATVFIAGPDIHSHRIGIVEQEHIWLGDLADIAAKVEQ